MTAVGVAIAVRAAAAEVSALAEHAVQRLRSLTRRKTAAAGGVCVRRLLVNAGDDKLEFRADNKVKAVATFDDMGLRDKLLRGIFEYGFEKPSAIQQRAIVPIARGRDVIAQAQSGTGKVSAARQTHARTRVAASRFACYFAHILLCIFCCDCLFFHLFCFYLCLSVGFFVVR